MMTSAAVPRGWWRRQVDEIAADRALTYYGAALALANVFTWYQFQFRSGVPTMIGRGAMPLCWPFWEDCHPLVSATIVNRILYLYLLLSVVSAFCFVRKLVVPGWWTLLIVNVIRTAVMVQDYRLRANQHYMLNCMVIVFVLLPGKRALLHHVLVSIYFWAGVLKLDREWLTGAALYGQDLLWIPSALVPASCVYVVLLETTVVFGVYARRTSIFYATLAQLVAFHVFSWPIVGFWYPTLMFCLLAIFPLSRLLHPRDEWVTLSWRLSGPYRAVHVAVLVLFAAVQQVPRAFPGDSAVTGEGRVFALHMFDALVECQARLTYHMTGGGDRQRWLDETERLPHRTRCDPIIYYDIAKNTCRQLPPGVKDIDVLLRSKHSAAPEFAPTIDIKNFCAATPGYDMWRHNAWIAP